MYFMYIFSIFKHTLFVPATKSTITAERTADYSRIPENTSAVIQLFLDYVMILFVYNIYCVYVHTTGNL